MHRTLLALLLVAGLLVLTHGYFSNPAPGEVRIRLVVADAAPVEDFLQALAEAMREPVVWSPACKEIRRQQMVGETVLEGSEQSVLIDARALLGFYELRVMTLSLPQGRIHVVTRDAHTCGLGAHD